MKLAVQVIAYPSSPAAQADLEVCLASVLTTDYLRKDWCLVIIDNPASAGRASEWLQGWLRAHANELPEVFLVTEERNTGFSGGHAHGYARSKAWGAEGVFLLNQDAYIQPNTLSELARTLQDDISLGAVQAAIVETGSGKVSLGNCLTYTGFGYADIRGGLKHFYASGAATLYRVVAVDEAGGLFDERYFLYHEDTDVCWRLRLRGWRIGACPTAHAEHRYEFARSKSKFFWIERNRWVLLLTHYQWTTFLRIAPILLLTELASLVFAFLHGWGREKLRAWANLFTRDTMILLRDQQRLIHSIRQKPDAILLAEMLDTIEAQPVDHVLVRWVLNPLLRAWGRVVRMSA